MAREWSYWTRNKLEILAGYLPAFNRASQTSRERIYLDLMAGQPENIDRDMGEKFDGSSLIAMKADPPFTRLRFCELNPLASELDVALRTRFPGDGRYRVVAGDSNVTIDETLAELGPWRWAPTFAFIDQQAAEVHWETINKVAAFRQNPRNLKTELWMLMSPTMIARGVKGTNAELFIEQVTRMYGDADWKRIQAARWRHHLTAPAYRAEMVNLMRVKLEYELGYKYSHRIPMQMHNKVTIFDMVFATDHWAGDAIMCHLYNRAAQKEPEMMRQAKSAKQQKESEDRGEMGLFSVGELAVQDSNAGQILWAPSPTWDPRARAGGPRIRVSNLNKRHFIPTTSVEFTSKCLWCSTAPLLEEEWDISGSTGIANMANPLWIDRAEIWTRFASGDNPINRT